jgi:hypothetical protein
MRHTVCLVEAISIIETIDNLGYAERTKHSQWPWPAGNPGIEIEFGKCGDVIGVKVGEEDRLQTFQWQATKCCDPGRASTGVNQGQGFSGKNRDTGLSTIRIRKRRGCAAHEYLEAVVLTHRRWLLHRCSYSLLEKPVLPSTGVPDRDRNRYNENANTG